MRGERKKGLRYIVVTTIAALAIGIGGTAFAQVPSLPNLPPAPPVPAPVMDAVTKVQGTAYPYLFTAAEAASPVATAGGFALRPPCGELGLAAFAIGLG